MNKSRKSAAESPILVYGPKAAFLLRDIAEAARKDILKPISGITLLILETAQTVKANKDECIRLCERVYELICAIINLCGDLNAELPLAFVNNIVQLSDTLQKVLTYVRRQADGGGLMKRLLRHAEHSTLLAECNDGIKHALALFQVQSSILSAAMIANMQKRAEERCAELLEMISSKNESLMEASSLRHLRDSGSTLSLAPPSPKIFHGRQRELDSIISLLSRIANNEAASESTAGRSQANIAILGTGGVGKSALALAVLHHPECIKLFQTHRFFVSCESAHNVDEMASAIASYFKLRDKGQPSKSIIRHLNGLASAAPVLLVLDNFETPWEPLEGRTPVENLLSLLTEVEDLSLILTMRGAERPQNVLWSRPFLPPLLPLDKVDARQVFCDICDINDSEEGAALDDLLAKTDYLPLAVTLMASLVSFEGSESVLERWSTNSTSLLSEGYDKRSNLEKSIMVSISSPRMAATPGAKDLLGVASLLPDGLSPSLLERLSSLIPDVSRCRATLCRTSLGYIDQGDRLKVLAPIREFVKIAFPPPLTLIRPLRTALYDIVGLFAGWERTPIPGLVGQVASDLGNIYSLISYSMEQDELAELRDTTLCVTQLAAFHRLSNLGSLQIITSKEFKQLVIGLEDKQLEGQLYVNLALSWLQSDRRISDIEEHYAEKALECFEQVGDIRGQAQAYYALSLYRRRLRKFREAISESEKSCELAERLGESGLSFRSSNLCYQSRCHSYLGQSTLALLKAKEGLDLARPSGNIFSEVEASRQCSLALLALGDFKNAEKNITECLTILSALGLNNTNSNLHRGLWMDKAEVALRRTEYATAQRYHNALLDLTPSHRNLGSFEAMSILNLIDVDVIGGNYADPSVSKRMGLIRSVFTAYNSRRALAFCDATDGEILLQSQKYDQAEELLLKAMTGVIYADPEVPAVCFERLGHVHFAQANVWTSLRFYSLFFAHAHITSNKAGTCQALRCLGDIFRAFGDVDTAKCVWEVALEGFSHMGVHRGQGDCLMRLGDLEQRAGNSEVAHENWSKAKACFERCPLQKEIGQCNERLGVVL